MELVVVSPRCYVWSCQEGAPTYKRNRVHGRCRNLSPSATLNMPISDADRSAVIDRPQSVLRSLLLHPASREFIASLHVSHVLSDIVVDSTGWLLITLPLCLKLSQRTS